MKKFKEEKIMILRHSLAHVLAMAVKELYPNVKFGIGPAVENGFYYDFGVGGLLLADLPKIEKRMREIVKKNFKFEKKIVTKDQAEELFKNQPFKLELIKELPGEKVITYTSGSFTDLCQGPHLESTGKINADSFKLTKLAGAYWKGDEKNPMLTRIYGLAFETKKELADYLKMMEEAEKRDHRILGQKLELFLFDEEVGAGLPIWMPKGALLRHLIEEYLYHQLIDHGYGWVVTPHIGKIDLWKTSGHWEMYRENIYSPIEIEGEKYLLKPMNCPFHVKVFKSKIRSYKELPIKLAELGTVYRFERSGTLHGLTRVRGFTQDDAHVWCTAKQVSKELEKLLRQGLSILKGFGFKDFVIYLSTRPEKYAGSSEGWEKATNILKYLLNKMKLKYQVDPGGGVFYGPKIVIKIKDVLGREWQCTTLQVDFNLPERFDMAYINEKGNKERPYMIHRALLGSMERFIGVLLEHTGGALPFWLCPEQIWIIPIGSSHRKYAQKLADELSKKGFRIQLKSENETISKKIREGELQKIPYLLVVGDREMKKKSVGVRERGKGDIGMMKITKFLKKVEKEKRG